MLHFSGIHYKIDEATSCWIAVSHNPNTAGYIYINRVFLKGYLHRIIFSERVKPLAAGERIGHICKNKLCLNPDHLTSSMSKGN